MGAVVGHCWSIYVGFAGGMGLGTLAGLFLWQQPLLVAVAAALWGLSYLLLRDSPRAVMAVTVVLMVIIGVLGGFGQLSPQATTLGIGGLAILFLRHLTQLPRYDRRARAN
jgi:glycerol-3-phosphate acyltransferase PlsY